MTPEIIVFAGDSAEIVFRVFRDKDISWNLSNYQIRFQLNCDPPIKKATSNVVGGSDSEILITNASQGEFMVFINSGELMIPGDYDYEIEITSPDNKKYTIVRDKIRVLKQIIEWESK